MSLPGSSVDVIVPICGAPDELSRCLASLCAATDFEHHRLVLVVDGPQPEAVEETLRALDVPRRELLRNDVRSGFVASVNRAMARSDRDVLLLNSDTEVSSGWVDKLQQAAHSAPEIATATPFSNNATICSLPRFLAENTLPEGHSVDTFAALVERCSLRRYPRIPTGVGFCLYIKRPILREIGLFDERRFGLGYGEETSFCLRTSAAGYHHVLDDATFVFHQGQSSFGADGDRRRRAAVRRLRRQHPGYWRTLAGFIAEDPLAPLRRRVTEALDPGRRSAPPIRPRKVVHLVHGWPPFHRGGTELYAAWVARRQAARREVAAYARIAAPRRGLGSAIEHLDHGVRVRLVVNNFDQRNPLARNALDIRRIRRDFVHFLDQERPDLLHVHHLAGHGASLLLDPRVRRLPVLFQIQDWWGPCARVNLFHRSGRLCSGPRLRKCSRCRPLTTIPPASLWNPLLHGLRRELNRRALAGADGFLMGSEAIASSYRQLGLLGRGAPTWVVPYGVELDELDQGPGRERVTPAPLRCGVVGAIMPHKGVHVAVEAFARIEPEQALLEVWGDPTADSSYGAALRESSSDAVRFPGPFADADKGRVLGDLDVLIVPSLGLESYGLVAREALSSGVVVLASRRGALAELPEGDGVAFFEPGNAAELKDLVQRLVDEPELLHRLEAARGRVKGMEEHVDEIEEIYRRILERSG